MLSIVQIDKKDHATATPKAWSSLLRFPTVDGVARTASDEESDYKARLGAVIVQLRGLRGNMSQADLAVAIHRSEPTLSRWELGKSQPSAFDLTRLAAVLEAPAELLLDPPERPISPVALRLAASEKELTEEIEALDRDVDAALRDKRRTDEQHLTGDRSSPGEQ